MNQSRLSSFIEQLVNIAIGFNVAITSQLLIFPIFNIYIPLSDNFAICGWFTLVSIIRGYIVRRWFNKMLHNASVKVASKLETR